MPHLLNALARPLLPQQVAVVKEGGKRLAPAPRRVALANRAQHPLDLDHAALGDLHRLVALDPLQQTLGEPLANGRLTHLSRSAAWATDRPPGRSYSLSAKIIGSAFLSSARRRQRSAQTWNAVPNGVV